MRCRPRVSCSGWCSVSTTTLRCFCVRLSPEYEQGGMARAYARVGVEDGGSLRHRLCFAPPKCVTSFPHFVADSPRLLVCLPLHFVSWNRTLGVFGLQPRIHPPRGTGQCAAFLPDPPSAHCLTDPTSCQLKLHGRPLRAILCVIASA